MELSTIIMGAVLITICVLPFVLTSNGKKKREQKMLQYLTEIAKEHNCKIGQSECCNDFIIGIDEVANFVFFAKKNEKRELQEVINLANIEYCNIINSSRTVKLKDENHTVIDKLELAFYSSQNKIEKKLELYNSEDSLQLYMELQCIEKWSKLINEHVKKHK